MQKGKMVIYKTTNLVNGLIYVGKCVNDRKTYLGSGKILKLAIKNMEENHFTKEILEICDNEKDLEEREIFWIKKLNARDEKIGYNIAEGGEGGKTTEHPWNYRKRVKPHTDKHKEAISESLRGHIQTKETKEKISKKKQGISPTKEHRKKISKTLSGRKLSDSTKSRMSLSKKGIEQTKISCPFCGKTGGTTMYRWHFQNCKQNGKKES